MKTTQITVPEILLLDPLQTLAGLERRSQFLLAVTYFELGELSSGQAARMCDMGRTAFLLEAGRIGVAVADLSRDEVEAMNGLGEAIPMKTRFIQTGD